MTEEKPQDRSGEHLDIRGGVYDGILADLHIEDAIRERLEKIGETELIERNNKLLGMLGMLPYETKDDLKTLSLNEIKGKYGLEGEQISAEFLVTGLYEKTRK